MKTIVRSLLVLTTVAVLMVGCSTMQREFLPDNADTTPAPIQTHLETAGHLISAAVPTPLGETIGEILSGLGVLAGTFAAYHARKGHAQSKANAVTLAQNSAPPQPPKS